RRGHDAVRPPRSRSRGAGVARRAERPHRPPRIPGRWDRDGVGEAAGVVRPGRHAADRPPEGTGRVRVAGAERMLRSDHVRFAQLLEQYLSRSEKGTARPVSEASVAGGSLVGYAYKEVKR